MNLISKSSLEDIICRYKFVLPYLKNKKVLEVGCGFGIGARLIHDHSFLYRGIDISKRNIYKAKKNNNKIRNCFKELSAYQINKLGIKFDVIICLSTIYYLDFDKFLKSTIDVLKKNGLLIFDTTNVNMPGLNKDWDNQNKYYQVLEMQKTLVKYNFKKNIYFGSSSEFTHTKVTTIVSKFRLFLKSFLNNYNLFKIKKLIIFLIDKKFLKLPVYLSKKHLKIMSYYKKIEKYKNNYKNSNIIVISKYL
jgi:2-polyprenyl-3-methyl-5-hydroxy-6-metoxy-1,4-benzoquinol methylase